MSSLYAGADDFDLIIKHIASDVHEAPFALTLGEELAVLSLLLRVYTLPDLDDKVAGMVQHLCAKFAEEIIRRYPFAEGYLDFLFGNAAFRRGGL